MARIVLEARDRFSDDTLSQYAKEMMVELDARGVTLLLVVDGYESFSSSPVKWLLDSFASLRVIVSRGTCTPRAHGRAGRGQAADEPHDGRGGAHA
jgi:hypothetical protein